MKTTDVAKEIIESLYVGRYGYDKDFIGVRITGTQNDIELYSADGLLWIMEKLDKITT